MERTNEQQQQQMIILTGYHLERFQSLGASPRKSVASRRKLINLSLIGRNHKTGCWFWAPKFKVANQVRGGRTEAAGVTREFTPKIVSIQASRRVSVSESALNCLQERLDCARVEVPKCRRIETEKKGGKLEGKSWLQVYR